MSKRAELEDPLSSLGNLETVAALRILVMGAGGLGCEIIKNLALSGFKQLDIIDLDTIELSNLNRQFLFSEKDIGQPKATVAAAKVREMANRSGICIGDITSHVGRIEDKPDSFYKQFHIVVCGLDSVSARRWINAKLVDLCYTDPEPSGLRPLIDGGSQGFQGQCRTILPGVTPCYECTLSLLIRGKANSYALCTLASIPRLPEHCIEWSRSIKWRREFGADREPDVDNMQDMEWLFNESKLRAKQYNIEGVIPALVYGVLKNIVPAIASTNAVIAAACCVEALKLSRNYDPLNNYFMYTGDSGVYTSVFPFEKREDCPVCGSVAKKIDILRENTLREFLTELISTFHCSKKALASLTSASGKSHYMHNPPSLRKATEANLEKKVSDLLVNGEEVSVSHPDLAVPVRIRISFTSHT